MVGNVVCIMITRMVSMDLRCINLVGGCDVWCGRFANLICNCKCDNAIVNGAAVCTFCAAVIVVCV